jgi:hypothetical protein
MVATLVAVEGQPIVDGRSRAPLEWRIDLEIYRFEPLPAGLLATVRLGTAPLRFVTVGVRQRSF